MKLHKQLFVCLFVLIPIFLSAGNKPIFELTDPRGDDNGDGTIIYPTTGWFSPGDLDIVSFSATEDKDGTMFEVIFDKPISRPDSRAIDAGGQTIDRVAKHGFYKFNIDIYIDRDRKPGSGYTSTLPGRNATIQPEFAWERVVCLTPRPTETRAALQKILTKTLEDKLRAEKGRVDPEDEEAIKTSMDMSAYYFPDRVRVTGRKIDFFVPSDFLGGVASPDWGYVVFDTAATIEDRFDLSSLISGHGQVTLMNLPLAEGGWSDRLGTSRKEETNLMSSIVDLLVPSGTTQVKVLRSYDYQAKRRPVLPGIVPSGK